MNADKDLLQNILCFRIIPDPAADESQQPSAVLIPYKLQVVTHTQTLTKHRPIGRAGQRCQRSKNSPMWRVMSARDGGLSFNSRSFCAPMPPSYLVEQHCSLWLRHA